MNNSCILLNSSIASQPGADSPSILLRDDTRRSYILGGLRPDTKYRVQVRARTSVGLSTSPGIMELTTNLSLGKEKSSENNLEEMNSILFFDSSIKTDIHYNSSRNDIL